MTDTMPRPEYPRPDLMREEWQNLNGAWRFAFDDANKGLGARWFDNPAALDQEIVVPFPYQSPLSGINKRDLHPIVWYARSFQAPAEWAGKQVLLHFGAVDYRAQVWVNGIPAAANTGGYVPFSANITPLLQSGENQIVVRVEDYEDPVQPRGKQSCRLESWGYRYTRTTGIWQSVWLEPVAETHVTGLRLIPDIQREVIRVGVTAERLQRGVQVRARVSLTGSEVAAVEQPVELSDDQAAPTGSREATVWLEVPVRQPQLWSPAEPNLYDISVELVENGQALDRVESYFGMREVSLEGGRFCLNGKPYTLKLVLDQGFWPDGVYTPPTDEAIRYDVEMTKAFGFNGARKHQKVEDPRYLYWADRLGLIVWGEMANNFAYTPEGVAAITSEWQRVVRRDWNHPCIVTWAPLNESWGIHSNQLAQDPRQVEYLRALYRLTKALDNTRPVIENDGWEHIETDILSVHDYAQDPQTLICRALYFLKEGAKPAEGQHLAKLPGFQATGQPIMITEYGGITWTPNQTEVPADGWGYGKVANSAEELAERFTRLTRAMLEDARIAGYCYTQLTDVEQEINGLLTYDRKPKVAPEIIAKAQE